MQYQVRDRAKLKRQQAEHAISLAIQGRWEEAITVNQAIIEVFGSDVDAYNRLGKALTELGRYAEARQAYSKALEFDPHNNIALKNLQRLSQLKESLAPQKPSERIHPHLFIEETGKTGVSSLYQPAPREVLAQMSAGDPVYLRISGQNLVVENARGEYLGLVEPKLGLRLAKLIEGGNRYVAAIASLGENGGTVIIKEIYQHPSQVGRLSFPTKETEGFRPYIKDTLLKYELGEEEAEEAEPIGEWEEEEVLPDNIHLQEEEEEEVEDLDDL